MQPRSKHIVIATHYYPPHHGGIEQVARQQATRLAASGHHVTVVTSRVSKHEHSGDIDGVHVERVRALNVLEKHGIPFPLFAPSLWWRMWRVTKQADVVHAHDAFYLSSLAAAWCARLRKKPLLVTQHVAMITHPSKLTMLAERLVYGTGGRSIFRTAGTVFTLNDRVKDFLQGLGVPEHKLAALPNGVDTALFCPAATIAEKHAARKAFKLPQSKPVVLFVGRFVPKKGFDKVLAASSDAYQLVFAGGDAPSGPAPKGVTFAGKLPQKKLAVLYRAADVFVLPSEAEGFPLSVQEAMASGLPVITSDDHGYARYELDPKNIKLVKHPTAAKVRAAIEQVLGDAELHKRMSAYSRAYAEGSFSWPHLVAELDSHYTAAAPGVAKPLVVTTSWDDGHVLDMHLAKLLKKYQAPATFYISPRDREFPQHKLLTDAQIKKVARDFEIGAHTMNHPRLHKISDDEAWIEMTESKTYLEKLLGRKVSSFCYPGGNYLPKHAAMARRAGFVYARTVKRHAFGLHGSLMEGRTSVNTYNHYQDLFKIAKFAHFNPFKTYKYFHWDELAIAMFDHMQKTGGVFHLWGHSWEVDGHGDWEKLEKVLKHITGKPGVHYVTNGELPEYQPKKLLIAAPYFPPHLGGQEFYAYNVARGLKRHGWDVQIATAGHRGLRVRQSTYKGLPVHSLPYWGKLSNTPLNPRWGSMFRKLVEREDIRLINTHQPVVGFGDLAIRAGGDLPKVVTYHMTSMKKGNALDVLINLYEKRVLPATLGAAERIICASDAVRTGFLQAWGDRTVTVTPGADTEFFTPAPKLASDNVLYVGSVKKTDTHKCLRYLLKAFAGVHEKYPKARLTVVGSGDIDYFQDMCKHLQIKDAVIFTDGLYGTDLRDAYRSAGVFVLPSSNESFGTVIVEAMASGLPVVSTNVGAIPTIVEHGRTGYIVAPKDSAALQEKIEYLLAHPKKAAEFGAAARARIEETYAWKHRIEETHRILSEALGVPVEAAS